MSKLEDFPITQSADERKKALMTAWQWGFDAAMDYRDKLRTWDSWPSGRPMPEPQINPWKVSESD